MANMGLDGRLRFDENGHDVPLRTKQMNLNDGRPTKKQIFGELKNVMHGQQFGLTPIKGNAAKIDGLPEKLGAPSSLCNDLLRKQHLKQNFLDAQKLKSAESYKEPIFDEEMFDSWDYDRKCCQHQKREEEVWAEMVNLDFIDEFRFKIFEDELETQSLDHVLLEDIDDDVIPRPVLNSMIETEEPDLFELPELQVNFEELNEF